MRKIFLLIAIALLTVMCKSKPATTAASAPAKPQVQYKDDFRPASAAEKNKLLKDLRAVDARYSVLIFTKGYKGEKVVISNTGRTLYSGNIISNLKSGIAAKIRIENATDTKVYDSFTKADVIIEAAEAQKHKYIYLMKDNENKDNPFTITYSNTLRPLR